MSFLEEYLPLLRSGSDLELIQAESAAGDLARADLSPEVKKAFLTALNEKGETLEEVAGFAAAFRRLAVRPRLEDYAERAIDVCGTGGDKSNSFNISTAVTLVLASTGVKVFKHGNRSITSQCGSAELLQALGVTFLTEPGPLRRALQDLNFVFFFAPAFHPAFKEIMPIRHALAAEGKRTIFNILGPMINPGAPGCQLTGVFSGAWTAPMAGAFHALGLKNGMVVHTVLDATRGMDELACCGTPQGVGFGQLWQETVPLDLRELGLKPCQERDLKGGNIDENLQILRDLLAGKAPRGLEDTVCLNAGAAFFIMGNVDRISDGIALARNQLLGGAVEAHLKKIREFFVQ